MPGLKKYKPHKISREKYHILTEAADPEAGGAGPGLVPAPLVTLGVCVANTRVQGGGVTRVVRKPDDVE